MATIHRITTIITHVPANPTYFAEARSSLADKSVSLYRFNVLKSIVRLLLIALRVLCSCVMLAVNPHVPVHTQLWNVPTVDPALYGDAISVVTTLFCDVISVVCSFSGTVDCTGSDVVLVCNVNEELCFSAVVVNVVLSVSGSVSSLTGTSDIVGPSDDGMTVVNSVVVWISEIQLRSSDIWCNLDFFFCYMKILVRAFQACTHVIQFNLRSFSSVWSYFLLITAEKKNQARITKGSCNLNEIFVNGANTLQRCCYREPFTWYFADEMVLLVALPSTETHRIWTYVYPYALFFHLVVGLRRTACVVPNKVICPLAIFVYVLIFW